MAYRIKAIKTWPRGEAELLRTEDGRIAEYPSIEAAELARRRLVEEYGRAPSSMTFRLVDLMGEEVR